MSIKHRFFAYIGLISRYGKSFAYYWQRREALSDQKLSAIEAEFLPAALAIQESPVSPAGRWVARILMLLIFTLLIWSIVGQIDIVVSATGKVIPSSYTKTIAAVETASVRAIHVEEGQQVSAGDVLLELDTSASDADQEKATGQFLEAMLQMARSHALVEAVDTHRPPVLPSLSNLLSKSALGNSLKADDAMQLKWEEARSYLQSQYWDFASKLQRTEGEIQRYTQELPLATQRAKDYQELALTHDVSLHTASEKEQARVDLQGQLSDANNQRLALMSEVKKQAYDAYAEANKTLLASQQDALKAASHSALLKLTAPVSGTIQQLSVHTVGGVVSAAQPLMLIVPVGSKVEVEATLENKDVGFVQENQLAAIKVEAFEYTKYGTVPAHVSHISRDAVPDKKKGLIYTAMLALDKNTLRVNGRDMPISAGMSVGVEIKTGKRRVIEYVLAPLLQHGSESLRER